MTSGTPSALLSAEATAAPKESPASATPGTPAVSWFQVTDVAASPASSRPSASAAEQPGGARPRLASDGLSGSARDQVVTAVAVDVGDSEGGAEAVAVLGHARDAHGVLVEGLGALPNEPPEALP